MSKVINEQQLYEEIQGKLIEMGLISRKDNISIKKIYRPIQNGETICHYLVIVHSKKKKLLIRTLKEKDYSYTVMNYLIRLNKKYSDIQFPTALAKPFVIEQNSYIVTSYLEGKDLNVLLPKISNDDLIQVSDKLNYILKCIHTVTDDKYSDGNQFSNYSYAEIMFNKIYSQLHNESCVRDLTSNIDVNKLLSTSTNILSNATFSQPTLIHMDIKPANIILSPCNDVHLIDFELCRFADLDYEWTNILIKTLIAYDTRFKQYVLLPILEKNFMPLKQALEIDKYRIYMLYLSINLYIYYNKCSRTCPTDILKLINMLINQLN